MTTKTTRTLAALLTLVAAMVAATASPAGAQSTAAVVVEANGRIFPGLTLVPTYQTWGFRSATVTTAGVVDGHSGLASSSCDVQGETTIPATTAVSAGVGDWACYSGPLAGRAGNLTYVRWGPVVVVDLTGSLGGGLTCHFEPYAGQNGVTAVVTDFTVTFAGGVAAP